MAATKKSQIRASVLDVLIKNKKVLAVVDLIQSLLTVALFLVVTWYCVGFLDFSIMAGSKTPVFKIPYYIGHSAVLIGFALMFFYSLVYCIQDIAKWVKKKTIPINEQNQEATEPCR